MSRTLFALSFPAGERRKETTTRTNIRFSKSLTPKPANNQPTDVVIMGLALGNFTKRVYCLHSLLPLFHIIFPTTSLRRFSVGSVESTPHD